MIVKDFDAWNTVKKEIDKSEPSTRIKEGEVRWSKFGVNVGYEALGKGQGFKRPVLILKKYSSDVFLALPLTKNTREGTWYYKINNKGNVNSVLLNQARVLDRRRLEQKLFDMPESELDKIKSAFISLLK